MSCKFDMLSYTHAYKAVEEFRKFGINATVERIKGIKKSGCGYRISVEGSCKKAMEICRKINLNPEKVYTGDDV